MDTPKFTAEQMRFLTDLLTPRCCHVSGEHDPTHFKDDRGVCWRQKGEAFDRARRELGLGDAKPEDALPHLDCCWCKGEYTEHPRFQKAVAAKEMADHGYQESRKVPDEEVFAIGDRYFFDVESLFDYCSEVGYVGDVDLCAYMPLAFSLGDLESALERAIDTWDHHEDAEFVNVDLLDDLVRQWNSEQTDGSWYPNGKKVSVKFLREEYDGVGVSETSTLCVKRDEGQNG